MKEEKGVTGGILLKGIGNKLYRVLQLSVQKHLFILFFKNSTCWTENLKKESYLLICFLSLFGCCLGFLFKQTCK